MELWCHDGCLLWGQRIIIPKQLRNQLLAELRKGHVPGCVPYEGFSALVGALLLRCYPALLLLLLCLQLTQAAWTHPSLESC